VSRFHPVLAADALDQVPEKHFRAYRVPVFALGELDGSEVWDGFVPGLLGVAQGLVGYGSIP
jgi:hypothetical protein